MSVLNPPKRNGKQVAATAIRTYKHGGDVWFLDAGSPTSPTYTRDLEHRRPHPFLHVRFVLHCVRGVRRLKVQGADLEDRRHVAGGSDCASMVLQMQAIRTGGLDGIQFLHPGIAIMPTDAT
jgi:hypothetical protein